MGENDSAFGTYFSDICASKGVLSAKQLHELLYNHDDVERSFEGLMSTCHRWFSGRSQPRRDLWPALFEVLKLSPEEQKEFSRRCRRNRNVRKGTADGPDQQSKLAVRESKTRTAKKPRKLIKRPLLWILSIALFFVIVAFIFALSILRAATLNTANACRMIIDQDIPVSSISFDQARDLEAACESAALLNSTDAALATFVGLLKVRTARSIDDLAIAKVWFTAGYEAGNARAALELGNMYEDGMVPVTPFHENTLEISSSFYKDASDLELPEGDLCYAISLLWNRAPPPPKGKKFALERVLTRAAEVLPDARLLLDEIRSPTVTQTVFVECSSRVRQWPRSGQFPEWVLAEYGKRG